MEAKAYVMGLFEDENRTLAALDAIAAAPGWAVDKVLSPIPSEKISAALKVKRSPVGYFTLAGGIVGFLAGFMLAMFTASQWSLIVSGKPIIALVPFFIVGFEFTILFAVLGNVAGLILTMQLPAYKGLAQYDERCSGEHYGIVAACVPGEEKRLIEFFEEQGGEGKALPQGGKA